MKSINVKRLSENLQGTDYIIGDLHGMYALLKNLLSHVNFNKEKDRLFSVGDLSDRGNEPVKCLSLLKETWFNSVLGNHDLALIKATDECLINKRPGNYCRFLNENGGDEFLNILLGENTKKIDELVELIEIARDLAYIIVVGEGEKRFNIVHSQLVEQNPYYGNLVFAVDEDIELACLTLFIIHL